MTYLGWAALGLLVGAVVGGYLVLRILGGVVSRPF